MIETCALGDVVDVSAGQPAPNTVAFSESGIPFIRAGSLANLLNGGRETDCEKVPESTAAAHGLRLYPKDTVVFAKSGMSATLGRVYRLKGPAYVVSHLATLVPTGSYDPAYLTHWLRRHSPARLIKDRSYPSIRVTDIAQMRVPHVNLPTQARIAGLLDEADVIHHKKAQARTLMGDFLRSTFLEMFGDPAINPMEWPLQTFESVLIEPLRNGISPSSKGRISARVLTLSAITGSSFDSRSAKDGCFLESIAERDQVSDSDFYICRGNGNRDLVGKGAFATAKMNGVAFPDTMIAAQPDPKKISRAYLEAIWKSPFIRSQIFASARTTNGTYKINQTATGSLVITLPPIHLQEEYQSIFDKVRTIQKLEDAALEDAETLIATLSERAFSGKL